MRDDSRHQCVFEGHLPPPPTSASDERLHNPAGDTGNETRPGAEEEQKTMKKTTPEHACTQERRSVAIRARLTQSIMLPSLCS